MLAFSHILRYIALKISGLCIADRIFDFCRHSARLMYLQITKRFVILNAKREKIRIFLKRERIATRLTSVSPAGSVGASASQRCPPDTRTAMTGKLKYTVHLMYLKITKRFVILNAKREKIRISLKRERIAAAVYTASQ